MTAPVMFDFDQEDFMSTIYHPEASSLRREYR
jgi:hypothetical protein